MDLPDFLAEWPEGEIVLTGHRIGLYSVIDLYQRGFSPSGSATNCHRWSRT